MAHFSDPLGFLVRHGILILFITVFIEEAGLPLPAVPWILAAGALVGQGKLAALPLLAAGSLGSTLGDLIWYVLGRRRGGKILKFLCRVSLEPDTCVGSTKSMFERHGSRSLILAKFIPAVGTVIAPLAGMYNVGIAEFLAADMAGSIIFVGSFGTLGYAFSDKFGYVESLAERLGFAFLLLLAAAAALYIGYKWVRRRLYFRKLMAARISVDELRGLQEAGTEVLVFDVRSSADLKVLPRLIPGARWIAREEFSKRHAEIPRDREIVVYCACPNEASAATFARMLQDHGFERVRPLRGGIDAWVERDFPTELAPEPAL